MRNRLLKRRRLAFAALLAGALASSASAYASPCECVDAARQAESGLRLDLSATAGRFDRTGASGHYEGMGLGVGWTWDWFSSAASLSTWHVTHEEHANAGLGDLTITLRGRLWNGGESLQLGAELASHLPTGNADEGLGMGHSMLMPSLWVRWTPNTRFRLAAQAGWSRALTSLMSSEHMAHTAAPASIVNPMNASELGASVAAVFSVATNLTLEAKGSYAAPIEIDGEARAVVGLGIRTKFDELDLGIEGQLPVLGDPFSMRVVASLGMQI